MYPCESAIKELALRVDAASDSWNREVKEMRQIITARSSGSKKVDKHCQ